MDYGDFRKAVFEKLHVPGYAPGKSDEELLEAMEEYADCLQEGFQLTDGPRGIEHGIEYAAWNIAMCI